MLASGRAPLGALLVLIGAMLPVLVVNRVFAHRDGGREASAAVPPFGGRMGGWRKRQRLDWLWVTVSLAGGLGPAGFGLTCSCGGG